MPLKAHTALFNLRFASRHCRVSAFASPKPAGRQAERPGQGRGGQRGIRASSGPEPGTRRSQRLELRDGDVPDLRVELDADEGDCLIDCLIV